VRLAVLRARLAWSTNQQILGVSDCRMRFVSGLAPDGERKPRWCAGLCEPHASRLVGGCRSRPGTARSARGDRNSSGGRRWAVRCPATAWSYGAASLGRGAYATEDQV